MDWVFKFVGSTVGRKALMALSGVVGFGFAIGHMVGNLQIYMGPAQLDAYARALHENLPLLWGTRILLLGAIATHLWAAISLQASKNAARPVRYQQPDVIQASLGSRTMIMTGMLLLAFILYHLAHFTWGIKAVHPQFEHLRAYNNVITGFQAIPNSVFYIVAMVFLGLHLAHGGFSMFYSLGLVHPRYLRTVRMGSYALVGLVVAGNISIPLAVMVGALK